jgi:hypothetical protein
MVTGNDEPFELLIQEDDLFYIDSFKSKVTDPSDIVEMRCLFDSALGRKATKKLADILLRFGFDVATDQEFIEIVHAWRRVPYGRIISVLNTAIFVAKMHSAELGVLELSLDDKK